jgi:hypothetical protein
VLNLYAPVEHVF